MRHGNQAEPGVTAAVRTRGGLAGALGLLLALSAPVRGADHRDSPAVAADPSTDLGDLYGWMSEGGGKVTLALTTFSGATSTSRFSNAAYYIFHTASRASFPAQATIATDLVCSFEESQRVSCWVGGSRANYVTGDASLPSGISSRNGKVRVYAGVRDDPFFFNQDGWGEVRAAVKGATLVLDGSGCPTLDAPASSALLGQLQRGKRAVSMGELPAPQNAFRGTVLALVVEVDRSLLSTGGPILSVWAATHRKK